ncbi:MAG TPA: hypothetical protein VN715_09460 [Roseiarcus sp.]|nr:hypothetical protein [Roseiarcus sp.]
MQYLLNDGTRVSQALIAPAGGWRLEAYLLDREQDDDPAPARSLLMRRINAQWGGADDLPLQKAIIALGAERPGVSEPLADLLLGPDASALAHLVGAHLLLLSLRRDDAGSQTRARFDTVVGNLQASLGANHPDVAALALAFAAESQAVAPVTTPPMFERSWRILAETSLTTQPSLIPSALYFRVGATMPLPPYFAWRSAEDVRKARLEAMKETLFARPGSSLTPEAMVAPTAGSSTELKPRGAPVKRQPKLAWSQKEENLRRTSVRVGPRIRRAHRG